MSGGRANRRMLEQQIQALERTAAVQQAAVRQNTEKQNVNHTERVQNQLDRTLGRLDMVRRRLDALDD